MIVFELIKILANVCQYNAEGKIYIRVKGKTLPFGCCIDDFIDEDGKRKRVLTFVPKGDDYCGE